MVVIAFPSDFFFRFKSVFCQNISIAFDKELNFSTINNVRSINTIQTSVSPFPTIYKYDDFSPMVTWEVSTKCAWKNLGGSSKYLFA